MTRIGFDIGGILSKYPDILRPIVAALLAAPDVEVHVLSDMHPRVVAGFDSCFDWHSR